MGVSKIFKAYEEVIEERIEARTERIAHRVAELLSKREPAPAPPPQRQATQSKLLSLPEAAEYLGVGESTLRGWVKAKKLPYTCPGGTRYKFSTADLDEFARTSGEPRQRAEVDYDDQSRKNLLKALQGK